MLGVLIEFEMNMSMRGIRVYAGGAEMPGWVFQVHLVQVVGFAVESIDSES
jgi:hypothetical protein